MHEIKIYTRENKSSKTCEYQPDKLDDHLIENNHEECSDFGIKPRKKLLGLNEKSKAALRKMLSELELLIIDEISMVSSNL